MRVPFFEVRLSLTERDSLRDAADRVIQSGQYILGPEVEAFEQECAAFLGVDHAIGVSSGTDALIASLMALDIGPGDGVVVPAFTFVATATAVARVGAAPIFCDVRENDLTLDLSTLHVPPGVDWWGTIPVDLFGACARTVDDGNGGFPGYPDTRLIIEDAAQAFGSFVGQGAATFVCHSFFPTKNLGGFGDGGLVTTRDKDLADRVRAIRNHGSRERYVHDEIGGNFRLDAMQAALLRVRLRSLPNDLFTRRVNCNHYFRRLRDLPVDRIRLPQQPFHGVPNQYVVRVLDGRRDGLRKFLADREISTEIYYPRPLHLQPCFAHLGYKEGDFPVAEKAAKEVLALPIFPGLREEEIDYVCGAIREFFETEPLRSGA